MLGRWMEISSVLNILGFDNNPKPLDRAKVLEALETLRPLLAAYKRCLENGDIVDWGPMTDAERAARLRAVHSLTSIIERL